MQHPEALSLSPPPAMIDAAAMVARVRRRRLAMLFALLLLAGLAVAAIVASLGAERARRSALLRDRAVAIIPPPELPRMDRGALLDVTANDAVAINRTIPVLDGPVSVATPFLPRIDRSDQMLATDCLAAAIYYEAAQEGPAGQRAVAQVVLNRVRHPAFPKSVCGVVFQGSERSTGCQFTFTCDGSMRRTPNPAGWARARAVAEAALAGSVYAPVGWATHYHADYVVPNWAHTLGKITNIGRHIFYRWKDGWGEPRVYRLAYAGGEAKWQANLGNLAAGKDLTEEAAETAAAAAPAADQAPRVALRDLTRAAAAPGLAPPPAAGERWALRAGSADAARPGPPAPAPERLPIDGQR